VLQLSPPLPLPVSSSSGTTTTTLTNSDVFVARLRLIYFIIIKATLLNNPFHRRRERAAQQRPVAIGAAPTADVNLVNLFV
jgi:hypothetical protein